MKWITQEPDLVVSTSLLLYSAQLRGSANWAQSCSQILDLDGIGTGLQHFGITYNRKNVCSIIPE
jgi:hypothetical protein